MALPLNFDLGRGLARVQNLRSILNNTGERAFNILRQSGVSADTQTITIGADVYEVDTLAAAGPNLGAAGLPDSTAEVLHDFGAAHGLTAGQVLKCESEILRVKAVQSDNVALLQRQRSGTTKAAHAGATATTKSAVTAGRIPLGVAGTTADNLLTALEAEINNGSGIASDLGAGAFRAVKITTAILMIVAKRRGVNTFATTETLANGAWDAANCAGGIAPSRRGIAAVSRAVTAAEATANRIDIPLDFNPTAVIVQFRVTASGALKAWDGQCVVTPASGAKPAFVTIDNTGGAVDFAGTDTLHLIAVD